jgi:phenylalanyl-tRNA synthetase beta chain
VLLSLGLTEVITYSLTDKDSLMLFDQKEDEVIKIMNPLSTEQEVLRTNFYPGLCRCIATNLNQQGKSIAIFEIADIFRDSGTKVQEELALGLALCGEREMLLEQGMVKERFDFLYLKGILEALFERLGVQGIYFKNDFQGVAILVKDIKVGSMIKAQGQALDRFEIKNKDVFLAQISLEKIFSLANLEKKFLSLPKYPALNRDISFIVKEDIPVQDIISAIKDKGGRLLAEVKIIDVYQGKQIPQGYKGLTISCSYRLYERTLTEEEVNPIHSAIQETLINTLSVKLR